MSHRFLQAHDSASKQEEVAVWEEERRESRHCTRSAVKASLTHLFCWPYARLSIVLSILGRLLGRYVRHPGLLYFLAGA